MPVDALSDPSRLHWMLWTLSKSPVDDNSFNSLSRRLLTSLVILIKLMVVLFFLGHILGPVLCHSFCNYIGFPAMFAALDHPQRTTIFIFYILGVVLFFLLLYPMTDPALYGDIPICYLLEKGSADHRSLCSWHHQLPLHWPPWMFYEVWRKMIIWSCGSIWVNTWCTSTPILNHVATWSGAEMFKLCLDVIWTTECQLDGRFCAEPSFNNIKKQKCFDTSTKPIQSDGFRVDLSYQATFLRPGAHHQISYIFLDVNVFHNAIFFYILNLV